MKVELDDLKMNISQMTDEVFVGITDPKNPNVWKYKKNLTNNFLACAIQRWNGFKQEIQGSDGKKYIVSIQDKEKVKTPIEEALNSFRKAFKEDPEFRETYKASIAMAFQDAIQMNKDKVDELLHEDYHIIANDAAEEFLTNWMKKEGE